MDWSIPLTRIWSSKVQPVSMLTFESQLSNYLLCLRNLSSWSAPGAALLPSEVSFRNELDLREWDAKLAARSFFFGCRNETQDFLYKDELLKLQERLGPSFSLVTAFSRPHSGSGKYVQDCIAEHEDDVCELILNNDANFYICGSATMARDVSRVLGTKLSARRGWDDSQLRSYMERQKRLRRWQQDVWG